MDGLIKEILSSLGLPSIGISLILLFFIKLSPITTFSSSPIEMKLSTKEKRFYVTTLRVIAEVICYMLIYFGIQNAFFTSKNTYNPILAFCIWLFIFVVTIWVYKQSKKNKTVSDIQNKVLRGIWVLFSFLSYICIFGLPAYLIGTQVFSEFYKTSSNDKEVLSVYMVVSVLYLICIVLCYQVIGMYNIFLGFSRKQNINLRVRISSENWFILHPIEKELFLLGDESILTKCTQIKVIEKTELLKNKIEIIK